MAKEFIILVGNVGTGKTTESKKLADQGYAVVRIDDLRHLTLSGRNKNYNGALDRLTKEGVDIVVDGKNHTKISRARILGFTTRVEGYHLIAMDFGPGNDESLQRRLNEPRMDSEEEIRQAHNETQLKYEPPTLEEGFNKITPK